MKYEQIGKFFCARVQFFHEANHQADGEKDLFDKQTNKRGYWTDSFQSNF
jgi:hypothetical protein